MPVDNANQADGLGDRGEAPGTAALGVVDGFPFSDGPIAIALSDTGVALAAWSMKDITNTSPSGEALSWSSSAANAGWTAPARLSQAGSGPFYFSGLTIKSNSSGNFALGWGIKGPDSSLSQVALRFLSGRWESQLNSLAIGQTDTFQSASAWDLDLLTDNGMVTAASFHDRTTDKYTHAIVHVDAAGTTTTPAQTDLASGSDFSQYSYFATLKNGSGLFIYTEQQFPSNTYKVFARLASVSNGQFAPQEITTFTGSLCAPLVAATSLSGRTTLALMTGTNCSELHLINVDVLASTIITDNQVIPTGSTALIGSPPRIVVDAAGNALAVWIEVPANQNASFKWSAAPLNGNWSTPADLIPNFASPVREGRLQISLAMNPAGQAAAAVRLPLKAANGEINQFISVSRYTAAGGWQEWKAVANKAILKDPIVSINTQGNAIVGYRGMDSTRRQSIPRIVTGTTVPDKVFALKF